MLFWCYHKISAFKINLLYLSFYCVLRELAETYLLLIVCIPRSAVHFTGSSFSKGRRQLTPKFNVHLVPSAGDFNGGGRKAVFATLRPSRNILAR